MLQVPILGPGSYFHGQSLGPGQKVGRDLWNPTSRRKERVEIWGNQDLLRMKVKKCVSLYTGSFPRFLSHGSATPVATDTKLDSGREAGAPGPDFGTWVLLHGQSLGSGQRVGRDMGRPGFIETRVIPSRTRHQDHATRVNRNGRPLAMGGLRLRAIETWSSPEKRKSNSR